MAQRQMIISPCYGAERLVVGSYMSALRSGKRNQPRFAPPLQNKPRGGDSSAEVQQAQHEPCARAPSPRTHALDAPHARGKALASPIQRAQIHSPRRSSPTSLRQRPDLPEEHIRRGANGGGVDRSVDRSTNELHDTKVPCYYFNPGRVRALTLS